MIQRVAYHRLLVHNAARISLLITALGVSIFLQNLFMILFSSNPISVPTLIDFGTLHWGDLALPSKTILNIGVSVVMMVGLQLLVNKTKIGRPCRPRRKTPGPPS